jgi:L-alanine-DL-glutamate epimerase-like enolase superfamily enzyme
MAQVGQFGIVRGDVTNPESVRRAVEGASAVVHLTGAFKGMGAVHVTGARDIAKAAREVGLGVMVGNMCGSSLSMAPSFVLGQLCDICDLDGPIFLKRDRDPAIVYRDGTAWCGEDIWGAESQVAA